MNKIKFPTVNESMVDKILVGPTMNTSSNASSSAKRLYLAQFLIFMFNSSLYVVIVCLFSVNFVLINFILIVT